MRSARTLSRPGRPRRPGGLRRIAVQIALRDHRHRRLWGDGPDVEGVALVAAAELAAAAINPIVVGQHLGEGYLPWPDVDVAGLVVVLANGIGAQVIVPGRNIDEK